MLNNVVSREQRSESYYEEKRENDSRDVKLLLCIFFFFFFLFHLYFKRAFFFLYFSICASKKRAYRWMCSTLHIYFFLKKKRPIALTREKFELLPILPYESKFFWIASKVAFLLLRFFIILAYIDDVFFINQMVENFRFVHVCVYVIISSRSSPSYLSFDY